MENASKALLMAGGILIALMIAAVVVLMFSNMSGYFATEESIARTKHAAEFNNQYEPYIKEGLTLFELKSVYNKILSNNKQNPEYKIKTNIENLFPVEINSNSNLSMKLSLSLNEFQNDFSNIDDTFKTKSNLTFYCVTNGDDRVEYRNPEGRISEINFEKTP